jgi:hypothetical protein
VLKDYAAALNVVRQDFPPADWRCFRESGMTLIEKARYQLFMLDKID